MPSDYLKKWINTKSMLLVAAIACLLSFSCKKAIKQQEENIIIQAVTDGQWYVELYTQDTTDITSDFLNYEFQFYKNNTVDGIKNAVTTTGTWSTDITSYTITATFPANASDTLKLLNYTWKITDSYLDYVEAQTNTANGNNILHLRKK